MIVPILFGVGAYVCLIALCKAAATPDGRTCPRPPKRVVVRGVQVGQFQPAPRNRHGAN